MAITEATGFVGARLLELALGQGHEVRALTRRPQEDRPGVEWIMGDLGESDSLERLAEGSETVIHVAGVINAPSAAAFEAGNVAGTAAVLGAAAGAGVDRFVHVSSLAAREAGLSRYGATKARSEELVMAAQLPSAIVRPPAELRVRLQNLPALGAVGDAKTHDGHVEWEDLIRGHSHIDPASLSDPVVRRAMQCLVEHIATIESVEDLAGRIGARG